jgi:spore germination protein YaaH
MRIPSALTVSALALVGCATLPLVGHRQPEYWAFTAPWDPQSNLSARDHAGQLAAVVYGWIQLDSVTGQPLPPAYRDTLASLAPPTPRRMAIVSNYVRDFQRRAIRALGSDAHALAVAAGEIARRAESAREHGLVLDFEGLSAADLAANVRVVRAIADSARRHGAGPVTVAIPALDTAAYPARAFFPSADYVMVMLYDQHWATSPPGPISSPDWVRQALELRVAEVGAGRVVAALPLYGYQWRPNAPGEAISYDDARRRVGADGARLSRDPATQTLTASRFGSWDIWVTDAELVRVLIEEVQGLGVARVAFWRLGQEDPALWRMIGR